MESKYKKDFDQKIKNKLDDFSPEVSPSLWAGIEKGIDADQPENAEKTGHIKMGKAVNLSFYFGVAASLVFIGFVIWKLQPEEKIFLKGSTKLVQQTIDRPAIDTIQKVVQVDPVQKVARVATVKARRALSGEANGLNKEEPVLQEPKSEIPLRPHSIALTLSPTIDVEIEETKSLPEEEVRISLNSSKPEEPLFVSSSEEPYLPNSEPKEKQKIVSTVLNFVANNLIKGNQDIEFTETEHGILKVDLKRLFVKNNRSTP